jgi:hypothetical protein
MLGTVRQHVLNYHVPKAACSAQANGGAVTAQTHCQQLTQHRCGWLTDTQQPPIMQKAQQGWKRWCACAEYARAYGMR